MDIEVVAKVLGVHGGALDVPAGATRAQWAVPGRLAGLGHLPQHEVQGFLWHPHHVDPGTGLQLLPDPGRELAVVGVRSRR